MARLLAQLAPNPLLSRRWRLTATRLLLSVLVPAAVLFLPSGALPGGPVSANNLGGPLAADPLATPATAAPGTDLLTPQERAWLDARDGQIRIAPDPDYPPIMFRDKNGQFQGLTREYMDLLEERLGFSFKIVHTDSWDELITAAQRREVDVVPCLQPTPARAEYLLFSPVYVDVPMVILARDDERRKLGLDELAGLKVAVVTGYSTHRYLEANNPGLTLFPVPDTGSGLEAVSFGLVDAMVTDLAVASAYTSRLGLGNLKVAGRIPELDFHLTFGSRNDWPLLNSILTKGFNTISEQENRAIRQRWLSLDQEPSLWRSVRYYLVLLGSLVLAWVLVVVWTRSLRHQVAERTAALEASEERFAHAIEAAQDGIWDWDIATNDVYYSPRYATMLGYDPAEVTVGFQTWLERIHPEDREGMLAANANCIENRAPDFRVEFRMRASDGGWRWIEGKGKAVARDENGRALRMVGTHTDITGVKQAQQEALDMERQVLNVQKLESLGLLAGGIAHDFNNLLMAIQGNADLAQEDLPADSPVQEYIAEIQRVSSRAADLARQMLAYSGKGQFVIQAMDLGRLIRETSTLLEVSISKKVELRYELAEGLPPFEGDATQIRQILLNLITNASEAIGDTPGVITLQTGRQHCDASFLRRHDRAAQPGEEGAREGEFIFFQVRDTGSGMDAATLERLFEPFFTTKFTGRGLGMSAVLGIVRGHGGAIRVDSRPGGGTTFQIFLPLVADGADAPEPTDDQAAPEAPAEDDSFSGTVLLADDDPTVREVGRRLLAGLGFTVLTAADGQEALDLFRAYRNDIVCSLIDLTMPRLDGRQVLEAIRRVDARALVLLCSGYNEQDTSVDLTVDRAAGFLQKPFTRAELRQKIGEMTQIPR